MVVKTVSVEQIAKDILAALREIEDSGGAVFITEAEEVKGVLLRPEDYQTLVGPSALQAVIERLTALGLTGQENAADALPKLRQVFSWIEIFEEPYQWECITEILSTWRQFQETGDRWPLREAVEAWEATARVEAAPELAAYLTSPREEKEYIPWEKARAHLQGDPDQKV